VEKIFFDRLTAHHQEAFSCLHNSEAVRLARMASKLPPHEDYQFLKISCELDRQESI
jgi:hypothetical protein